MRGFLNAACLLAVAMAAGAQNRLDLRTQTKNVDFSGAASTRPFRIGTELPATCSLGEAFFKSDAPAGENLYACTATNVWTLESGANPVPPPVGQANKVLSNDGVAPEWRALGGDVTGPPQAATVVGLQGQAVSSGPPADGQVLRWSASGNSWAPASPPSAAVNYSQAFTDQSVVTIAGAAHGLNTANLLVDCYDNATPAARLDPSSVTVHPSSYDVVVTFASAQTGRCVVNGSGAGTSASTSQSNTFAGGTIQTFLGALVASGSDRTAPAKTGTDLPASCVPGDQFFKSNAPAGRNLYFCTAADTWSQMSGGLVDSVFGRTGEVTAAAGDYAFSQLSGTVANAQLPSGIDAAKIGFGTVTNTIFGYLATLTGNVQTQLDGKASASHSHTAAGDVTGDLAATTVTGLQSRPVAATAPSDGQALVWSAAAGAWQPGAGGGGGGATMSAQLGDFAVARTSPTVLTLGGACSTATPCNARFGNTTYTFTQGCTATISAGSGTGYIYVASGGVLTIGHNATVSASAGCQAQSSVTNFPADAIPLYAWTATSGNWDSGGGRDYRAMLANKNVSAGTGIATLESAGRTTVAVDTAVVPTYATAVATLDFPSIAPGMCASDLTMTVTGAVAGDAVTPGWPAGLPAGLVGVMRVSAANTVAVRLCNVSSGAIDPSSASYRAMVLRSF